MRGKINGLDLFSGIGGIGIALSEWVRTVAYCEQDRYAQGVLLSRMQSGDIDRAPIFNDVCNLRAEHFITKPEIIFGGFPCQDISVAGNGAELDGERSGLFFEICRIVSELRPTFLFLENVPAISIRGLDRVLLELTSLGYDCRWTTISAESVGAPHRRDRWFLLAYSNGLRKLPEQRKHDRTSDCGEAMANTMCEGLEGFTRSEGSGRAGRLKTCDESFQGKQFWAVEPNVGRVVNGLQNRAHRIKCLGNSVVPIQVKTAFEKLLRGYSE